MNGRAIWIGLYLVLALASAALWGQYQRQAEAQKQSTTFSQALSTEGTPWMEVSPQGRVETTTLTPLLEDKAPEGKAVESFIGPVGLAVVQEAMSQQSFFGLSRSTTLATDQGEESVTLLIMKGPGNPFIYIYTFFE